MSGYWLCTALATAAFTSSLMGDAGQAIDLIDKDSVKVLRIADYNTKGLLGPCSSGHPFHSLVKATGVSSKEDDTSGGSFGIGKNAVFAISDLQTVFYSTIYLDDKGTEQFLAQGKSILISHEDKDGTSRRSTGYWGAPYYMPIENDESIPEWLCRDEPGTSIFAVGFRESSSWQYRMAASLIRNFFAAIHRGEMEFSLDDDAIDIRAATLGKLFQDQHIIKAAEESSQLEDFEYAGHLYDCLTSEEAKKKTLEVQGLGKVLVQMLIRDGLPKRLSIIRNGMIITDSLEKFGDKFVAFRMYKDFVAFVEPLEDEGSALIKRLENPKHDGLSAERIPDEDKRAISTRIMRELAKKIREAIRSEVLSAPDSVQALDELAQFFADSDENEDIPDPDPDADNDPENYTYTPSKRKLKRPPIPKIRGLEDEGGGGDGNDGGGGDEGGDGLGSGAGTGGTGGRTRRVPVVLNDSRNVIAEGAAPDKRSIWFTPAESGEITLAMLASGMNTSDLLKIGAVSSGEIVKGNVQLEVVKDERQHLELTLSEEYDGPVELLALRKVEEGNPDAN
jgi:hypothetical protein